MTKLSWSSEIPTIRLSPTISSLWFLKYYGCECVSQDRSDLFIVICVQAIQQYHKMKDKEIKFNWKVTDMLK